MINIKKIIRVSSAIITSALIIVSTGALALCVYFSSCNFLSAMNFNGRHIYNYKISKIISESMEDEYLVGTKILVKHVDFDSVEVGDDIAFVYDDGRDVSEYFHRVHEVNYDENGVRYVITKGTNNEEIDPVLTYEENFLGVCIYSDMNRLDINLTYVLIFISSSLVLGIAVLLLRRIIE